MDFDNMTARMLAELKNKYDRQFVHAAENGQLIIAQRYQTQAAEIEAELLRRESRQ